jgi:hypothetical protein
MNLQKHFLLKSIAIITVPIAVMLFVARQYHPFEPKMDFAAFTTIPLFLLAILQLYRTQRTQQAASVKDFLGEFRRDDRLYSIFFDLIYTYRNSDFEKAKEAVKDRQLPATRPDFEPFKELQGDRTEGRRIFLPGWFGLSSEERRLDTLFDYFNTLGFYQEEGLIEIRDIARILGDYLAVLSERSIVAVYLEYCSSTHSKAFGDSRAAQPYLYVYLLVDEFKKFNGREKSKKEIAKLRKRITEIKNNPVS